MNKPKRRYPSFKVVQPILLFVVGIVAFGWEVFFQTSDRPYLFALIAGFVGLPFVIFADRSRNSEDEDEEDKDEKDDS